MKKAQLLLNSFIGVYWGVCVLFFIGYYSLIVMMRSWLGNNKPIENKDVERLWMNKHIKISSVRLLRLLKTSYSVEFSVPLNLNTDKPIIYMSNHQSLIDLLLIYATMLGSIRFIAKEELFSIPFFGKALALSGCLPIERADSSKTTPIFACAKEMLQNRVALWVFPEGTRSLNGDLLPFKLSAFRMAREVGAYIIPVGIVDTRRVLPAKSIQVKRYQKVLIRVGKPIDTSLYENIIMQKDLVTTVRKEIAILMRGLEVERCQ